MLSKRRCPSLAKLQKSNSEGGPQKATAIPLSEAKAPGSHPPPHTHLPMSLPVSRGIRQWKCCTLKMVPMTVLCKWKGVSPSADSNCSIHHCHSEKAVPTPEGSWVDVATTQGKTYIWAMRALPPLFLKELRPGSKLSWQLFSLYILLSYLAPMSNRAWSPTCSLKHHLPAITKYGVSVALNHKVPKSVFESEDEISRWQNLLLSNKKDQRNRKC
jgi:hypothetical protein